MVEFRVDFVLAIVSIVAGVVTIIWFIRDVRKENSKILRTILDTQRAILDTQKASIEIQKSSVDVLCKIEESQRKGFETLANIMNEGQRKIEEGQRKGFETLAQMLLNQTKILERINSRL